MLDRTSQPETPSAKIMDSRNAYSQVTSSLMESHHITSQKPTAYISLRALSSSTLVPLDDDSVLSSCSSGPMLSSKTGSGSFTSNLVLKASGLLEKLLLLERRRAFVKLKSSSIASSPALPLFCVSHGWSSSNHEIYISSIRLTSWRGHRHSS